MFLAVVVHLFLRCGPWELKCAPVVSPTPVSRWAVQTESGGLLVLKARGRSELEAGLVLHWLRAPAAFEEDSGSIAITHTVAHSPSKLQFQGVACLLLTFVGTRHIGRAETAFRQNSYVHKNLFLKSR